MLATINSVVAVQPPFVLLVPPTKQYLSLCHIRNSISIVLYNFMLYLYLKISAAHEGFFLLKKHSFTMYHNLIMCLFLILVLIIFQVSVHCFHIFHHSLILSSSYLAIPISLCNEFFSCTVKAANFPHSVGTCVSEITTT